MGEALKLAGAAYLVYLGVQSLTAALRRPPPPEADVGHVRGGRLGGVRAFGQGIVNNLANPKMAVFFASVLPHFAPASPGTLMALLSLGLGFSALTCVWLTLYAAVGARAGPSLRGSRAGRAIQGTTGLTLIGLGLKVATEEG